MLGAWPAAEVAELTFIRMGWRRWMGLAMRISERVRCCAADSAGCDRRPSVRATVAAGQCAARTWVGGCEDGRAGGRSEEECAARAGGFNGECEPRMRVAEPLCGALGWAALIKIGLWGNARGLLVFSRMRASALQGPIGGFRFFHSRT